MTLCILYMNCHGLLPPSSVSRRFILIPHECTPAMLSKLILLLGTGVPRLLKDLTPVAPGLNVILVSRNRYRNFRPTSYSLGQIAKRTWGNCSQCQELQFQFSSSVLSLPVPSSCLSERLFLIPALFSQCLLFSSMEMETVFPFLFSQFESRIFPLFWVLLVFLWFPVSSWSFLIPPRPHLSSGSLVSYTGV